MQPRVTSKEGFRYFAPESDAPRSATCCHLCPPCLLPCRRHKLATPASRELGRAGRVCHWAAPLEPRMLSFLSSQQLCPLQQLRRGMRKSPRHPVNNDLWRQAFCSRLWASSGYLASPSANKRLMHRSNWQQIRRWSAGEMGSADLPLVRPRQYDLELGEKPGLCLDIDAATVLLDDYVVAHRQAKPGTFA